jgi:hypothetical protein
MPRGVVFLLDDEPAAQAVLGSDLDMPWIERNLRASRGVAASRLSWSERRPDEAQASTIRRPIGPLARVLFLAALASGSRAAKPAE